MDLPSSLTTSSGCTRDQTKLDLDNDLESYSKPFTSYQSFSHRSVALFLENVCKTGKLGSGPAEQDPAQLHVARILLQSMPWTMLFVQLIWSSIVLGTAYALGDKSDGYTTLGQQFWTSHLNVSSSVTYAVGWALFVLLGFFIREASTRYRDGQVSIERAGTLLRQLVLHVHQLFPQGTWHPGDRDRFIAHVIAYLITLKMMLRNEREREQLEPLLASQDIDDIIAADYMHIRCLQVIRGYLNAGDENTDAFQLADAEKSPCGGGTLFYLIILVDDIDLTTNTAIRISEVRPAIGYVNHLRLFTYIWMLFLPLALVKTSGWLTVLWAVLITYGVGMLYTIANALNEPFGFDLQDVKLNRLCSEKALDILHDFSCTKPELSNVVREEQDAPTWLQNPIVREDIHKPDNSTNSLQFSLSKISDFYQRIRFRPLKQPLLVGMSLFLCWTAFILFLTWGIHRNDPKEEAKWWNVYVPVSTGTTGYVSLSLFLLLGFWISDAYDRYWNGLQLWQTKIRSSVEDLAVLFTVVCKPGLWHSRDRERILSHLVALPYVSKLALRDSRDLSELEGILSFRDIAAFAGAKDLPAHCLSVLYGYANSADTTDQDTFQESVNPMNTSLLNVLFTLLNYDLTLTECRSIRKFPISPSFTLHLCVFTVFWLVLLPLSLVSHDGFLSFLYLTPIGYSIIKLLILGMDLADPFGFDKSDIPLDLLCTEIKDSVHNIYLASVNGPKDFIIPRKGYERKRFTPSCDLHSTEDDSLVAESTKNNIRHQTNPTLRGSIIKLLDAFPSIPFKLQIIATIWSVTVVLISWGLSKTWSQGEGTNSWRGWISPIDVDSVALSNIGFALFMILAFRAADALNRYEQGATLIYSLEMELRSLTMETIQAIRQNSFHPEDKERIVAHVLQIPLCFRDMLLNIRRDSAAEKDGLLTEDDRKAFESAFNPIQHLLNTVQAYLLHHDSNTREGFELTPHKAPRPILYQTFCRFLEIRDLVARGLGVKRFPVVASYTDHQHLFTGFWLALLPLSMTPTTGFLTMLWAPIISYAVLGLDSLAAKLVDPYGHDKIDIPVDEMCRNISNNVLEAVHSAGWGYENYTQPSTPDTEPRLGTDIRGQIVSSRYTLPHFEEFEANDDQFGVDSEFSFQCPKASKAAPSFYAHLLESVPWWILAGCSVWTAAACVISYLTRVRDVPEVKWWKPSISISVDVATYVSFAEFEIGTAAFTLLGFYVSTAFNRYNEAGAVCGEKLRALCHSLAAQFYTMVPAGSFHEGDQDRIIGHIAAIPIVMKHELRGSRDIREVKGLLSSHDYARIQSANSMINYCVDVVRAYHLKVGCHVELLEKAPNVPPGNRRALTRTDIKDLELLICSYQFLRNFEIAPGFIALLKVLLGIWFLGLPFVLAEISGWFTILWVPLIAYGLLGMYSIAAELQFPFGTDLNDLDLDRMTDRFVQDILFVQKYYKSGFSGLIRAVQTPNTWLNTEPCTTNSRPELLCPEIPASPFQRFVQVLQLGSHALPPLAIALILIWSLLSLIAVWLVSKNFPQIGNDLCEPWFCSAIAISPSVLEYISFALFLLLGFRLHDSHHRYVIGLQVWLDDIIGHSQILTTRIFGSFRSGTWHEGDLERIAGYISAFAVTTMGTLRGLNYEDKLREVLGEEDVKRILESNARPDYCIDVVRAYLIDYERIEREQPDTYGCVGLEHWWLLWHLRKMLLESMQCQQIVKVPLPFGYVQHLRIFLIIWLILLPFGLAESTGWLSLLWIVFISYGVVGVEQWANELSNPFGFDLSDVPLDVLCDRVVEISKTNLKQFRDGYSNFVRSDRPAFPLQNQITDTHNPM